MPKPKKPATCVPISELREYASRRGWTKLAAEYAESERERQMLQDDLSYCIKRSAAAESFPLYRAWQWLKGVRRG
jgi:hypothetical protein